MGNAKEKAWRLLVAGGGTGGHVFPGVAVADAAAAQGAEVLFVGRKGGREEAWLRDLGWSYEGLEAAGMPRSPWPWEWASFLWKLGKGFGGARRLLKAFAPDAVFSTGGYASVAVSLAAALSGVPVVVLEPNVKVGLAARFLAPFARRVCTGFEPTARRFSKRKRAWTGIPVRREILEADRKASLRSFGLKDGPVTVLLLGGSQGAHSLNSAFLDAVLFMGEGVQPAQFIFMTGREDYREMTDRLEKSTLQAVTRPFIANIHEAYASADLVVGRSGAMTCAETAARGLGAVFVPYPHAGRHQAANARALADAGAALVVDQKQALEGKLLEALIALVNDRPRLGAMGEAARKAVKPDAADTIAAMLKGLAERKKD